MKRYSKSLVFRRDFPIGTNSVGASLKVLRDDGVKSCTGNAEL